MARPGLRSTIHKKYNETMQYSSSYFCRNPFKNRYWLQRSNEKHFSQSEDYSESRQQKLVVKILLTNWFTWKNLDDTIIFIQYLLLFLFRFVQLLTIMCNSNLEDGFNSAPIWPVGIYKHRVLFTCTEIFTVDGLITVCYTKTF